MTATAARGNPSAAGSRAYVGERVRHFGPFRTAARVRVVAYVDQRDRLTKVEVRPLIHGP
jgi:hypothetical protein